MPNWKKVITSGSDATLNNLEIKPKPAGTTTTHGANLEITPSGSATQFGLLITGSTGNGTPFAMIQTPVGGGGTGEFIYGKGISGENSFRIRQGAGGSGAFLLYTSQSHGTQHIAHNFTDPLQGGDSYINYSQDTRSDAYFGIGTNAPATHLHVSGNISASGTIIGQSDLRVGTGTVFIKANGQITASGNISASGDVITNAITSSGLNLVGTGTAELEVASHITASGNISASGDEHYFGGSVNVGHSLDFINNTSGLFRFNSHGVGGFSLQSGSTTTYNINNNGRAHRFVGNITASGDISSSGNYIGSRQFDKSTTTNNNLAQGDIIYQGGGSTTQGNIVYMKTDGEWGNALANAAGTSTSLLGIALGTDPDVDGVLLRGTYTLDHDVGNNQGVPLYISDSSAGQATVTAPSSDGDIIRIIGYNLGDDDEIWFDLSLIHI